MDLGKSTLLSAINFCLTGIVSDPAREFKSMEEYYTDSRRYSIAADTLRGRISEEDRGDAEITLEFRLGDHRYVLQRGMFESEELRGLTVTTLDGKALLFTEEMTRRERQLAYESQLTTHIGLSTFEEFVFLQHFVFTFDERRLTLFWNQKILERALYLAFGLSPDVAKRVDSMRRDYESADSQVRNRQWEATKTTKRINQLRSQFHSTGTTQANYDSRQTNSRP